MLKIIEIIKNFFESSSHHYGEKKFLIISIRFNILSCRSRLILPNLGLYEDWENHQPVGHYDGIVSIGAFEHFIQPGLSAEEKIDVYRKFFQRCHILTNKDAYLSLQTIVYENFDTSVPNEFVKEVFPESDLPKLYQIIKASEDYFEVVSIRNDRLHYAKTLKAWFKNLVLNKENISFHYGEDVYKKYVKYLGSFAIGFEKGTVNLSRIRMKKKIYFRQ